MNKVLWVLDNETSPKTFERLCVDLLFRNGYTSIIPVGGMHDRGRDAESLGASGTNSIGQVTFFQFSLQKDWKKKLQGELRKVRTEGHQINTFVFVTNQDVSGRDRDRIRQEVASEYGWDLIIFSREWLRLQLEEASPDLAQRHLGLQLPEPRHRFEIPFDFDEPQTGDPRKAWRFFGKGDYERAAIELREYLKHNANIVVAWEALAWSQYELFRYDEALASINCALEVAPNSRQAQSVRGCILAERGIQQGDRESVKEAGKIFARLIPDSRGIIHYNYGNALSALGRYDDAVVQYRIAAERAPNDARIWKNLATAYHELGEHEKEMECFDRAIEIDPRQPQAFASKGVSMLLDFGKAEEAVELMRRSLEFGGDLSIRWPHIWYWLGEACRQLKRYEEAMSWVERGLRQEPGSAWLRRLRFLIVAEEWKDYPGKAGLALDFFVSVLDDNHLDYSARCEVVRIHAAEGREDHAWPALQGSFSALDVTGKAQLRNSGFSLEECLTALEHLPAYITFRKNQPVVDCWDISDPEYLLSEAPPITQDFEDCLFVYCSVPFGKAWHALVQRASGEGPVPDFPLIFAEMRSDMEKAVPQAAAVFAQWIEEDLGVDAVSRKLAIVIDFAPVVALREWGRQLGWLAVRFELSEHTREDAIGSMVEADMDRTVMEGVLRQLYTDSLRAKVKR